MGLRDEVGAWGLRGTGGYAAPGGRREANRDISEEGASGGV